MIETFVLGVEQDIVSLRRRARAVGEEFGLDERNVRSFASAAYEAGRLLFSAAGAAEAELRIVEGPALQVAIVTSAEHLVSVRRALHESIEHLRALVDLLSFDETTSAISVSLSTRVTSAGTPFQAASAFTSMPADTTQPETLATRPAAGGGELPLALRDENAALRRSLQELQSELQETNSGVVALYGELVEQSEHLRRAKDDLRRRADELAAANRAKEEFLAALSHELRTPLNAMLGWTRLLRMGTLNPLARARALDTIERNARIQETLIADILDVSRIVTGKLRLDLRPITLEPIVDAALDAVRPAAEAKGVTLSCDVRFTGTVLGDPDRLQQVLWNLLSNAIKFTPAGERVTIEAVPAGSEALLAVTDTGEGISADLLPFVFDRFRQGDVPATRLQGGLGLGLSIVRHIVELHGGRVEATSDGPGRGSRFTVHLPVRVPSGIRPSSSEGDGAGGEAREVWGAGPS